MPGQAAPPVSLPNGRIALAHVDRTAEPIVKVQLSRDGARTFPREAELILQKSRLPGRRHGNHGDVHDWVNDIERYSIGLPDTAGLDNEGEFLVVYYNGSDHDHTDLEWVRLLAD